MKTRKCIQYICDYCGKRGLSAGHMRKHEGHCTANPARKCRMCPYLTTDQSVKDCSKLLNREDADNGLGALRVATLGCPACMLAAIRISKIQAWIGPNDPPPVSLDFDYKKEAGAFWARINEEREEAEGRRWDYAYPRW